ncbi:MAG TPA: hypothetical protein DCX08_12575 [Porticoccaceae bacterium]|jgi:hypothetical protein|nr:hypothetical protein [Porticoccaceae bacterium]
MPFTFERGGDIYCPENMAVNLDGITYKLNDETAFDIVDAVITKYTRNIGEAPYSQSEIDSAWALLSCILMGEE